RHHQVELFTLESDSMFKIGNLLNRFAISSGGKRFAFYDYLKKHILITSKDGRILQIVGTKRKGPKEFVEVLEWNFDGNDNSLVYDESQHLIKIFNTKGELLNTRSVLDNEPLAVSNRNLVAKDSLIYMPILDMRYYTPNREKVGKSNLVAVINY